LAGAQRFFGTAVTSQPGRAGPQESRRRSVGLLLFGLLGGLLRLLRRLLGLLLGGGAAAAFSAAGAAFSTAGAAFSAAGAAAFSAANAKPTIDSANATATNSDSILFISLSLQQGFFGNCRK
jgi:hypothetical protein